MQKIYNHECTRITANKYRLRSIRQWLWPISSRCHTCVPVISSALYNLGRCTLAGDAGSCFMKVR